jgi:hypothetical protein
MPLEYSLILHGIIISIMGYSFYKVGRSEGIDETLEYLHKEKFIKLEDEN